MKRLITINPFLWVKNDHHFLLTKVLCEALTDANVPTVAFVSKQLPTNESWSVPTFRGNVWMPFFTVKRLFSFFRKNKDGVVRLSDLTKTAFTPKGFSPFVKMIDVLNVMYLNVLCYFDMRREFKKHVIDSDTTILAQFIHQYYVFGFWFWYMTQRRKPKVIIVVELFPYEIPYRVIRWLFKDKAKFITDDKAEHYTDLDGVFHRPIPVYKYDERVSHERVLFGTFGTFRLSKGIEILTNVIERVSKDEALRDKVQFVVQGNFHPNAEAYAVELRKRLDVVESEYPKLLKVIRRPLENEEYYELLSNVDAVILPYYATDIYKHATSGILVEALCYEKLAIVSSGTELTRQGGSAVMVFENGSVDALYGCIQDVVSKGVSLEMRRRISKKSKELLETVGVQRIVDFFVNKT